MTMMQHLLLRLRGDRTLDSYAAEWGDKWEDRAERIGELWVAHRYWSGPPADESIGPGRQLDWGSFVYELSLDEIRGLLPPRPDPGAEHDWPELAERDEASHAMLDSLSPAGRYAVVWVECA